MPRALPPLPGVPESRLTAAAAGRLPADSPRAPWAVVLRAAVWWHPATAAARGQLPSALRRRMAIPLTVGAVVQYLDTPVGPYSEVLASPVLLAALPVPAAVVPFIAVDAPASVHGGRANWALPKVLARFAWSHAADGGRAFAVRAEGDDTAVPWSVTATVRPRRRGVPVRVPVRARQPAAGSTIPIRVAGTIHAATIEIGAEGPGLRSWLRPGRHPGVLLSRGTATVDPAG